MPVAKKEPITWHVEEYVHREKSPDWYWAVGVIAVSLSATAVLFGNALFAIVIALSFFALMLYAKRKPIVHQIKIDTRGIEEGRTHYPFSSLESFWVEDRYGGTAKIILKSKKKLLPYIIIPIAGVDSELVRDHIRRHVREEEHHEPLAKQVMEYLGF